MKRSYSSEHTASHSPFILNSIPNAVIYDLETHLLVENGLENIPYDGIVEGDFRADKLLDALKKKFERYRELVGQEQLSDDALSEIAELELFISRRSKLLDFDDTHAPKVLYSYVACNEKSHDEWDKHQASVGFLCKGYFCNKAGSETDCTEKWGIYVYDGGRVEIKWKE